MVGPGRRLHAMARVPSGSLRHDPGNCNSGRREEANSTAVPTSGHAVRSHRTSRVKHAAIVPQSSSHIRDVMGSQLCLLQCHQIHLQRGDRGKTTPRPVGGIPHSNIGPHLRLALIRPTDRPTCRFVQCSASAAQKKTVDVAPFVVPPRTKLCRHHWSPPERLDSDYVCAWA